MEIMKYSIVLDGFIDKIYARKLNAEYVCLWPNRDRAQNTRSHGIEG
jgi:hypothetical protein